MAYSLGNFLNAQSQPDMMVGAVLDITFQKTTAPDGGTTVEMLDPKLHGVVTQYEAGYQNIRVYPYADYTPTNWGRPREFQPYPRPDRGDPARIPSTKRSLPWSDQNNQKERVCQPMYGVSKISSEQNILLTTFPGAQYSAQEFGRTSGSVRQSRDRSRYDLPERPPAARRWTSALPPAMTTLPGSCRRCRRQPRPPAAGFRRLQQDQLVRRGNGHQLRRGCQSTFCALAQAGIEIVLITTSDLDISLLIRQQDEDTALQALQAAFSLA